MAAERDAKKIDYYRQLTARLFDIRASMRRGCPITSELIDETTTLLNMNPEFYTAWNIRRQLLQGLGASDPLFAQLLCDDLKLLLALLRRFPKCYWIWNHRKWCLFELVALGKVDWNFEFDTISKLLELDLRNYHGWEYRRFVVSNMELAMASPQDRTILCVKEFEYTTRKIKQNISNFSAWHNRSRLILQLQKLSLEPMLREEIPACFASPYEILCHELQLTKTGMYMDSDDTSVWLYLQWLITCPLFVDDLIQNRREFTYIEVLEQQLLQVTELNSLEKSEHPDNLDHCWCLKMIVSIKCLMKKQRKRADGPQTDTKDANDSLNDEITLGLQRLAIIDPLRRGRYLDQIAAKTEII